MPEIRQIAVTFQHFSGSREQADLGGGHRRRRNWLGPSEAGDIAVQLKPHYG